MSNKPEYKCQPQVSLSGRSAWVIEKLLKLRGTTDAEVARWVIDRWIDGEGRDYLSSYGIELADFADDDGSVVPIATGTDDLRR